MEWEGRKPWNGEDKKNNTYGKYRSVFPGKTSILALIAPIAAAKSPLYGDWLETSPEAQVWSIVRRFSGSVWKVR